MSGRAFIDTNVFIYMYDSQSLGKQGIAVELIRGLLLSGDGVVSYQVVHEFLNFALRKAAITMRAEAAEGFLATVFAPMLQVASSISLVTTAICLTEEHRV